MERVRRTHAWPALVLTLVMLAQAPASRGQVQEDALKAAFVFNFASFTTWVEPTHRVPGFLTICSYTSPALHESLLGLEGKDVKGLTVGVRTLERWQEAQGCDVLVVDEARVEGSVAPPEPQAEANIGPEAALADPTPAEWWVQPGVLTILNAEHGSSQGVRACITLVRDGERVRFDVDMATSDEVGIEFSSRLLNLARRTW